MAALGMIEVYGYTTSIVVADAVAKAADVKVVAIDKNKPANADSLPVPLIVAIKFRGSVEDVKAAVEAAAEAAAKVSGVLTRHIIANTEESTEKMLKLNAFDKN